MTVRVRIAPAPSGLVHVGNARTALFNWLFARHHGGVFVLRVEDTDVSRVQEEYVRAVMDVFRWLGLDWDEGPDAGGDFGPYRQSQKVDRYRACADRLAASGAAYPCFCTPEELDERRKAALAAGRPPGYDRRCRTLGDEERAAFEAEGRAPVLRFRVPDGGVAFHDIVRGDVRFDAAQIDDFVLQRRDGTALYTLAAAVDDLDMRITHVIRGEDVFAATPKQILILQALGAGAIPEYAHLPLLVGPDGQKLSKRHGDVSVEHYREHGFVPEAMVNYLALLGWSPRDGVTERFTGAELVAAFDLGGVTRTAAMFDVGKLTALNGEKIRALDPDDLAARVEPFLVREGVLPAEPAPDQRALLRSAVPLIQERIARLDEAPGQLGFLFADVEPDEKARKALEKTDALAKALAVLEGLESWDTATIQEALTRWADGAGLKRKEAFQPLRAAATGRLVSPPLFESLELLGREQALARIRRSVA